MAGLLGHSVPVCPAALCSLEKNCRQGEAAALWGAGTARPYRAVSPMAVVVQKNRGLIWWVTSSLFLFFDIKELGNKTTVSALLKESPTWLLGISWERYYTCRSPAWIWSVAAVQRRTCRRALWRKQHVSAKVGKAQCHRPTRPKAAISASQPCCGSGSPASAWWARPAAGHGGLLLLPLLYLHGEEAWNLYLVQALAWGKIMQGKLAKACHKHTLPFNHECCCAVQPWGK